MICNSDLYRFVVTESYSDLQSGQLNKEVLRGWVRKYGRLLFTGKESFCLLIEGRLSHNSGVEIATIKFQTSGSEMNLRFASKEGQSFLQNVYPRILSRRLHVSY